MDNQNQQSNYNFILGQDSPQEFQPKPKRDKKFIIIGIVVFLLLLGLLSLALLSGTKKSVVKVATSEDLVTSFHAEFVAGATAESLQDYVYEGLTPNLLTKTMANLRENVNLASCSLDESKTVNNTTFFYDCKTLEDKPTLLVYKTQGNAPSYTIVSIRNYIGDPR